MSCIAPKLPGCFIFAAGMFFASQAVAGDYRWTHYGARPLGMGNAFVAVADDYNSLFYNPAGLDRLKEWDGEFLNPFYEISNNTQGFLGDLMGLSSGGSDSTSESLDLLQGQVGKPHHFAGGLTPHLVFPGFGFGAALVTSARMVAHSDIDIEFNAGPSIILPIAYATNFLEKRLSVGAALKLVAKGGVDSNFTVQSLSALSSSSSSDSAEDEDSAKFSDYVEGGYGIGADLGLLFTPIDTMEPTLGISVTDTGGTPYTPVNLFGEAATAPDLRLPSVNTGVSFKPVQAGGTYVLVAADAHSVNQPHHYSHKLNLGVEYGWRNLIKVQAGLKAGYLTAGFQFDVTWLNIRFATYAEDQGAVVGLHPTLVDRRYVMSCKLII